MCILVLSFLQWGAKAFKNMLIVPPGSGIVHQVRRVWPHLFLFYILTIIICSYNYNLIIIYSTCTCFNEKKLVTCNAATIYQYISRFSYIDIVYACTVSKKWRQNLFLACTWIEGIQVDFL